MGTTAAVKQRNYRARRRDGRIVLQIEVSEVDLSEALRAAGFLDADDMDNREALATALERVIEVWTISVTCNDAL